jgi:nitrogen fixation protein NifU and related proteins
MSSDNVEFWRKHSIEYLENAFDYQRHEKIENADGYGKNVGSCGDTIEMYLTTRDELVERVSLNIDGCINTNACANAVASMIEGKPAANAWDISPEQVADYLKTLPEENMHCAELAVGALYLALADIQKKTSEVTEQN